MCNQDLLILCLILSGLSLLISLLRLMSCANDEVKLMELEEELHDLKTKLSNEKKREFK